MRNFGKNPQLLASILIIALSLGCQSSGHGGKKDVANLPTPLSPTLLTPLPAATPPAAIPGATAVVTATPVENEKIVYLGDSDFSANPNLPFGPLTLNSENISWIVARPQYVMSWNPKTHNINWVSWTMTSSQLGEIGRQKNFSVDPAVDPYAITHDVISVTTADYTGSCYDRGHQVASSDRQASDGDNAATFFTTNIIPQTAFLNQIIWKNLEDEIKDWIKTEKYKNLWIVSGPIYGEKMSYMGKHANIAIPKANFKAVFSWEDNAKDKPFLVKAVIMPNVLSKGEDPTSDSELLCKEAASGGHTKGETTLSQDVESYISTLPAIEEAARIKFPSAVTQP